VRAAKSAVEQTDGKVVVIGESMGSMVAWRVASELANGDDPPGPDDIRFVLIAPPEAGIAEYFPGRPGAAAGDRRRVPPPR
jgi:diacyltrehalose acyltransferase